MMTGSIREPLDGVWWTTTCPGLTASGSCRMFMVLPSALLHSFFTPNVTGLRNMFNIFTWNFFANVWPVEAAIKPPSSTQLDVNESGEKRRAINKVYVEMWNWEWPIFSRHACHELSLTMKQSVLAHNLVNTTTYLWLAKKQKHW